MRACVRVHDPLRDTRLSGGACLLLLFFPSSSSSPSSFFNYPQILLSLRYDSPPQDKHLINDVSAHAGVCARGNKSKLIMVIRRGGRLGKMSSRRMKRMVDGWMVDGWT